MWRVWLPASIGGLWYWCTDQYIVQRALAAKDERQALRGSIFASWLKLLPFYIFIIPGVMAFALANSGQLDLPNADQAFPRMVMALIPTGFKGLVASTLGTLPKGTGLLMMCPLRERPSISLFISRPR